MRLAPTLPEINPRQLLAVALDLGPGARALRASPDGKTIALFDLISLACNSRKPSQVWTRIRATHPEVASKLGNFTFAGQGQKPTPGVDRDAWITISMLLPGEHAKRWRAQYAQILTRYLDGDPTLAAEILDRTPVSRSYLAPSVPTLATMIREQAAELRRLSSLVEQLLQREPATKTAPRALFAAKEAPLQRPLALPEAAAPLKWFWAYDLAAALDVESAVLWGAYNRLGYRRAEQRQQRTNHGRICYQIREDAAAGLKRHFEAKR